MSGRGAGRVELEQVRASVASFVGYTKHCEGHRTTSKMLEELVLVRG